MSLATTTQFGGHDRVIVRVIEPVPRTETRLEPRNFAMRVKDKTGRIFLRRRSELYVLHHNELGEVL